MAHLRDVLSFWRDVEGRWRERVHTVLVNLSSVISSARAHAHTNTYTHIRSSPRQDTDRVHPPVVRKVGQDNRLDKPSALTRRLSMSP